MGAFGFHVHPSIEIERDTADLRVADIACGSGIWLKDIASQYPQAQCDGFDISDKQFPAIADLTRDFGDRVHYHTQDATAESGYGEEFNGKFDIVAVRLLHVAIAGAQWTRAVRNAAALLKPGGYLQWIDWIPQSARVVQSRPLIKTTATAELLEGLRQFLSPLDTGATARLPQEMRESGLADVRSELFATDVDQTWRQYFTWTVRSIVPDLLVKMAKSGPYGSGDAKDWVNLKAEAEEEAEQEAMWVRTEMWCHVGRKPMA